MGEGMAPIFAFFSRVGPGDDQCIFIGQVDMGYGKHASSDPQQFGVEVPFFYTHVQPADTATFDFQAPHPEKGIG
jgi:hypothetical protein